jgi:23S rRNA pseudouridine2605 synthase
MKAIGRLDMNTEGLLLLTNDGRYATDMENPKNQLHRTYRVRVHGMLDRYKLRAIRRGVKVKNVQYKAMRVELDDSRREISGTNKWIRITCTEGQNRQIRNVLAHLGLTVSRLIRISYGDYKLENIPAGGAPEVPPKPVSRQRNKGPLYDIVTKDGKRILQETKTGSAPAAEREKERKFRREKAKPAMKQP